MASGQKKKTTGKARQGGGQSRQTSRSPQKNPRPPIRREVGGGVCLLLALCVVVSYFQADAIVLNLLGDLLKGLTGYGYWLAAPALALAGVNLLAHRGRPVALRTVCTLVTPVLLGAILHLFLYQGETVTGLGPMMKSLWADGLLLKSGGAVAGGLAAGMKRLVGTMVSVIVLLLLLAAALLAALRVSPRELVQRARDRVPYEPQPEPERPARPERPRWQRPSVDVPLDDAPAPREKTADRRSEPPEEPLPRKKGKGFFARKGDDVMTPDQVLRPQTPAPQTEPPTVQEPAAEPVQTPAQAPAQEPVPEKKSRRGQAAAQEVEQHAQEVGQAIEEELAEPEEAYQYPPVTLLDQNTDDNYTEVGAELRNNSRRLAQTITSFGVDAKPGDVVHGPSVTRYEFTLDQGVKLSKLTNLADDIALALGSGGVRIAPIPNKSSVVGIEVPNRVVTAVRIRDVIDSRAFAEHRSRVAFAVGKDIGGNAIVGDIAKLPHVLIAGTTGSGKSVCTNSLIVSLLYKSTPEEVRFIMVDPKMVELAPYNGIPHLLIPVVTDPKKAAGALQWAVYEMMKRYKLFSENGVKDLAGFNALAGRSQELKKMPTVVVVIDELADLMLVAAKEVEESICRVAQMGRAAGMHLVIATQRPSSDVITGLMKANIPSRIAFAVASSLESRIILDTTGAEKLVGKGDMLYAPLGAGKPTRVQGCFITPEEIERVVDYVKQSGEAEYSQDVMDKIEQAVKEKEKGGGKSAGAPEPAGESPDDELLTAAVDVVLETGQASVSMLQRRLKLGYARAARLVDQMEERGYVGPFEGSKPRQLLIDKAKWQELKMAKAPAPEPEIDRNGSVRDVFESRDALD
ncbi:cell division protein FtsK [Oscillibacter sp. CAG:241]|nr:cell division protein FtsK [Oscillibacter sp. CAG:241]